VAALFAGLLGFLICEKFGFEMVDGGDFLFLFLYVIGLAFSSKLLIGTYFSSPQTTMFITLKAFIG
jgi:hypothetical protein